MKRYIPVALALALLANPLITDFRAYSQYDYNMDADYTKYYDKGIEYYNNNQFSNAIEQFEQALKLAPDNPSIRNNLAVSYISRGTYFHNKASNYEEAANNYRDAIYYLKYDAPEDAKDSPNAASNLDIALKNLTGALKNLNIATNNPSYHFKKAKELRAKGTFRGAIVEYFLALENSPPGSEAYEAIGDIYRVLQNNERATKAYEKAISTNKNNAQLYIKAGLAFEKNNDLNAAIKAYNEASTLDPANQDALNALQKIWEEQIKINPRNAAAHANLGTILQKKGNFDGALSQYNAAEMIEPNNILVRLNLGTLYQAKGDLKTAIRAYDTILQVEPNNILAHYYRATAFKQNKDYENAIKELNTILQIDPKNAMAERELLAVAKEQGGDNTKAVNILKDLANKEPDNAKAQYDAAFESHSKGDLDDAVIYYRRAIALDPKMTDAYSNIGAALIAKKQYNEALEMLNKAAELDPANTEVKKLISEIKESQTSSKYQEALSLHQQGKINEAIALYEEALKADPNNPEILTNLGAAYQTNKNYDAALAQYLKSIAIEPKSSVTYFYMGTTYYSKNQFEEAITNYKKALELDPGNQQIKDSLKSGIDGLVQNILSKALDAYNKKLYDQAKITAEKALQVDPNSSLAYYYLGLIMEAKNSVSMAIANYRKSTQLDPKMDSAFYSLAIALDKVNDKAGAKAAFEKYIQLAGNKNDAFVKYARERVKQL